MKKYLLPILIVVIIAIIALTVWPRKEYVVLVSMDAFRWDYDQMYSTPNIDKFTINGVKAESLESSYPTKTFPNHYSIATGLYPDNHGLISNTFFAPDLDLLYRIGDRSKVENGDFYGGEPAWVTASKNGIKTASMFWVGSEAPVMGIQPDHWSSYDGSVPYSSRVDSVITWLSLPVKERPRFITLYFDEPDATSHSFGPVSHETDSVVTYLDGVFGDLMHQIGSLKIGKRVNVILVSDHGMGEVSNDRLVNLSTIIPQKYIEYINGSNPVYLIDPVEGFQDSILTILNTTTGVKGYSAATMPEHYHYGKSSRFPGIVAEADSSWSIAASDRSDYYISGRGAHGYDPANRDMHGIFYADGPSFKDGYTTSTIKNIDVYNLICKILRIEPAPNDGDFERVRSLLK
jgi:alkaline phosphatase D